MNHAIQAVESASPTVPAPITMGASRASPADAAARPREQYVHYGCHFRAPDTWLNFDASPTLRFERIPVLGRLSRKNGRRFPRQVRYGDIVTGLPVRPESCWGVFCSHVLEHLALEDVDRALAHTYSYLRPGGVFRLVVPDLEARARRYLSDTSPEAAHRFMQATHLGEPRRARGVGGLLVAWLGNAAHRWMWDEPALRARLARHGFRAIRRAAFGDAEDPRFLDVEEEHRFAGELALEARR
jgi:hypothetical protein